MENSEMIFNKYQQLTSLIEKKILISAVVMVLLAGCQSGQSCKKVLNKKCIQCHSVSTNCAKVGESEQQWQQILAAMAQLGADISKKERKTLARCLSNPSGTDVEEFCK